MSGHSKWHSIRHKKGAADAKRGKIFTRHAHLITIAAREGGGDIDMNPSLRLAVDKAKTVNMPNSNIERAIKRGTGEDKDAAEIYEMRYEGYGPEGVAIIVDTLTDNKNRTVSSIRSIFAKNGGSMGDSGCVSWMFHNKGIITIDASSGDQDEIMLSAIDAGAEDVQLDDGALEVTTSKETFFAVKKALEESGYVIQNAEMSFVPENTVTITDEQDARKILNLIEVLEDDDDVSNVSANFDIPTDILEKISE